MENRDINYILQIAKEQNLTKAAEKLYISQPALSKFLKEKETTLGVKLFERIEGKYIPTYAGKKYLEGSIEIYHLARKLENEISDIAKLNKGELRVAFPTMRGTYMVPNSVPVFNKLYPNVSVIISEQNSGILENLLISGETDLAFFNGPIISKELDYILLKEEELVLIAPHDHPAAKYAKWRSGCTHPWIDINTFMSDKFILQMPNQRSRMACEQVFSQTGFKPNTFLVLRNIWAALNMSASGFALSMMSDAHVKHLHLKPAPLLFSVGEPPVKMNFIVAYRKNTHLTKYALDYIEIIRSMLNSN